MQHVDNMQNAIRYAVIRRSVFAWLLGFVLLPLPVPVLHQHDDVRTLQLLSDHLTSQHEVLACEHLAIDDPHWHFVLPQAFRGEDSHPDDVPPEPTDCVRSCIRHSFIGASFEISSFDWTLIKLASPFHQSSACRIPTLDPRFREASDAFQVYRCALSCVMNC